MTAPSTETRPLYPQVSEGPLAAALDRTIALSILGTAIGFVWALSQVAPDARGHGTHEQMGLPPCSWPILYGIPCPTCGVTTSAAHLVHGEVLDAFWVQPFGASLALAGLALAGLALYCLVRGQSLMARLLLLPYPRIFVGAVALLLLAWGFVYLRWE